VGLLKKEAFKLLQKALSNYNIEEAQGYLDKELRIDLSDYNLNKDVFGGIQVKPKAFNSMRPEVLFMQKNKI
jgi:hypothetical protein